MGNGLESNKSLTSLILTLYPPSNDPVFLNCPYYKPVLDEVLPLNGEVDYSAFVQGGEKSIIQDIIVSWNVNMYGFKIPQEVSFEFIQLQHALQKLPAEGFPAMTFPEYKVEDGDVHIFFKVVKA